MRKNLLILGPFSEWTDFIKFNAFIWVAKQKSHYELIDVCIPEKATGIVQSADRYLEISNEVLNRHNCNYPEVLDKQNQINLFKYMEKRIVELNLYDLNLWDILFFRYESIIFSNGSLCDYFGSYFPNVKGLVPSIQRDCLFLKKYVEAGNTLKTTQSNFNKIKAKYGHLFDDKTYIIITRNFAKKQKNDNTDIYLPSLGEHIKYLTERGIKIINIGFPPKHYEINNNYVEINDSLSQLDLISLFYLANGFLISGTTGGFAVHGCSNSDLFLLTGEWTGTYNLSIFDERNKNRELGNVNLIPYIKSQFNTSDNFEKMYEILNTHKKISKNIFIEEKPRQII